MDRSLEETEHSDQDSLHATVRIAGENVNKRAERNSEDWQAFSQTKKVVQKSLAQLFTNAKEVENVIGISRGERNVADLGNTWGDREAAKNLFDASIKEAKITPPARG